jgi:hypothetical protein
MVSAVLVGAREMLGRVHNLADVTCVMRELPVDGLLNLKPEPGYVIGNLRSRIGQNYRSAYDQQSCHPVNPGYALVQENRRQGDRDNHTQLIDWSNLRSLSELQSSKVTKLGKPRSKRQDQEEPCALS